MGLVKQLAAAATPVLNIPMIRRVRRNHGLEHATIHMLARGRRDFRMAGRSDSGGFFLYGEATTEEIAQAVQEALERMQSGQHELAIHPNCGTNLLTTGTLATLAALAGTAGTEDRMEKKLERFPTILLMIIGTLIFAPGLGTAFQRYFTTLGDPGDMTIKSIRRMEPARLFGGRQMVIHRIETANG